jgi:integrase/recombinase XerD
MIRQAKGRKDRTAWLDDQTLADFLRKWKSRQPEGTKWVFSTLLGKQLQYAYVRDALNRYVKRAHIKKDVHPHTLRHTFATELYKHTKDLALVQKALGHASISTTMIYTHLFDPDTELAIKAYHRSKEKEE